MKNFLLPLVMCVMFLSGCDLLGPSFSIDEGERVIHRIMNRNASSFSDDGDETFCIKSVTFQENYFNERKYAVSFYGKENGSRYRYDPNAVYVGKDEGGWYVQMLTPRNTKSATKFRE